MKSLNDYDRLFVFDTETTGLDWRTDQRLGTQKAHIIDLGAIVFEKDEIGHFKITKTFNRLINHGIEITPQTTQLTGITQQMIDEEGLSQAEVIKEIAPYLLGNTLIIAYNAQFDLNFITEALRDVYNVNDIVLENDILDPYTIFKDRYKYPHRLENAITVLGVEGVNSHRAMDDALATINVLRALVADERYDNPDKYYINVFTYNPKYGQSGILLPQVRYVPSKGGKGDILATIKKLGH